MLLRLEVRTRNTRLLKRHFRHVKLPTAGVMEMTLTRMTVALAAILDPRFCSRSLSSINQNWETQDRQRTYNVTLRGVREPLLPSKSNEYYAFCVCVFVALVFSVQSARAVLYCHLW